MAVHVSDWSNTKKIFSFTNWNQPCRFDKWKVPYIDTSSCSGRLNNMATEAIKVSDWTNTK